MRILNFNEPYYLIDNLISSQEEGGLQIHKSAKICDLGCGTGIIGRHLAKNGYTNIFGIDGSENVLRKSKASGNYSGTKCMFLGKGPENFPEELKESFDVVVASGIWMHGHVSCTGIYDAHQAVKTGGLFVTAMRQMYWVNGDIYGYKDVFDDLVDKGKFEFVKTFTFRRGVPGGDSLYAEQESILIVCKKIAH
jgi:SAM-dependent methyltransferase